MERTGGFVKGRSDGAEVHWVNDTGADLEVGTLVAIGPLVGLIRRGGEAGCDADVRLEGVASVPKAFGEIARETVVDYDAASRIAKTGKKLAKGDVRGFAVAAERAEPADAEVVVRLTPGRGVVS